MAEINFDLPSGKRRFWIDDHEIETEQGLDGLLEDKVDISDQARLIVKIEALRIECRELMWKICELMQELERMK